MGCGAGLLLKHLRDQGYVSLEGIDVSEEMVQLARAAGVSCVRQGDLMGLLRERDDSSVDVIFLMDVLEHMTRPEQFELMQQACRVLSPAGRVILHVPNAAGWFGMRIRYGDLTHEAAFTPSSLRQLAMATGFAKVQCFEDTPVVHGVKSGLRWVVWHVATLLPRMALAAETGTLRHVLSQNMTAVVWK